MLDYYKSLPDYISTTQLRELFEEFISSNSSNKNDIGVALESLVELADRQWHTYELIDSELRNRVEEWIIGICNKESLHDIELISLIIGRLGLVKVYIHLKNLLTGNVRNEIRTVIHEIIDELDGHVDDPYHGMK
ncbi:hypothetical protein NSQ91_06905 [Paenibacillus sp. FSL R7-0048]|uniref:hypothetical protein n=1 Tax=Paenibacillus TaxID=44249 RepID=UPI00096C7F0E|nr:hypothetical protein [Paenibacillus odorifer]OMD58126.1 hypothetical protein BSK48_30735 [Paenibacillus odorifer]OMD95620.1 hypothetical protein BSK67_09240 [Paenibacillus odorifer]